MTRGSSSWKESIIVAREMRWLSRSRWTYARLRVRHLIILVLVIGTGMGWLARRAHIQRDAVAAIVKAGGTVKYNDHSNNVGLIWNRKHWWSRWIIAYLGGDYFYTVVKVQIGGGRGSDAEMAQIGGLADLQELFAAGSPDVSDRGLACIEGLKKLRVLYLYNMQVTDAGMAYLKDLKNLEWLLLDGTKVTDAGLVHLIGLSNLRVLGLRNDLQVGDAGLVHLKGLTKLSWLLLAGTGVSDAGLVHLRCLTGLQWLDLKDTRVSDDRMRELRQALPNTIVKR
jgi:Leucine-rich repeat (LRR) protein